MCHLAAEGSNGVLVTSQNSLAVVPPSAGSPTSACSGPLVSIVMPAYNAAATIAETLSSVTAQSHQHLEILVVDDGSRDDTADIVSRAALGDPRIRLLRQENAGVAAARNKGLLMSRGGLIAPVDADDLWHPTKIARQVARLAASPASDVVYCWSVDIDAQSRVLSDSPEADWFEGDVFAALVLTCFVANSSVPLIRREHLIEAGGWDTSLKAAGAQGCEDWQLYLRLATRCQFALEPAFLVGYRQSSCAMSRQIAQMTRSYQLVMRQARQLRPDAPNRLFRWSEAAFHQYLGSMLFEMKSWPRALPHFVNAILLDPSPRARSGALRSLDRTIQGLFVDRPPRKISHLRGTPFALIDTDPLYPPHKGRFQKNRLRALALMGTDGKDWT